MLINKYYFIKNICNIYVIRRKEYMNKKEKKQNNIKKQSILKKNDIKKENEKKYAEVNTMMLLTYYLANA